MGRHTDIFHNRSSKVSEQSFRVLKMACDSDEDEFPGFEVEEADRVRVLRRQLSESDISVSSESDSSSESESEEEPEHVWTTDDLPVHVDDFVERTGPVSGVAEDGTALDFFLLLFRKELFTKIVEETNRIAEQCIRTKPDPTWYETMREEICAFLALNVLFGIKKQPESRLYWSEDPLLGVPTVQKIMPRNLLRENSPVSASEQSR